MTLSKQLYALILFISLLMGIGTLYISIENTRTYLLLELATQTQNSADSLGLSLVPHMKNKDIAAMDTMVNAMFDSGYYHSLSLQTMAGKAIITRENTTQVESVPQFFINHLDLQTPEAQSIIMSGWHQAGILTLTANPGFAYKKIWDASKEILLWSLLVTFLSFFIASFLLRIILRPLSAVEKQAQQISKREFPIVKDIPKTRELKSIVLAMNKMSAKLESIVSKLTQRAEDHRKQAYEDKVTGVFNRIYFISALKQAIKNQEQIGSGYVAIIRIQHFAEYNKNFGHQAGDKLLQHIVKLTKQTTEKFHTNALSRLSGVDFAIILPLADLTTAQHFGSELSQALTQLTQQGLGKQSLHIGIAKFDNRSTINSVLSGADTALASAQHQGTQNYNILQTENEAMGNQAWKDFIQDTLSQNNISFLSQKVVSPNQLKPPYTIRYQEVLIRIKNETKHHIPPASFAAMAERIGLSLDLDQYVIQHTLQTLEIEKSTDPLAVNISGKNLNHANFLYWLQMQLKKHAKVASKLYFELTEQGLMQNIEASKNFIALVHQYRGKVIMEHFGTQSNSLQMLRQLKVDFLKLDASYTANITSNQHHQSFIQSLVDITQSLDIQTIAEHIESKEQALLLKELGIDTMQGYFFDKPKPNAPF